MNQYDILKELARLTETEQIEIGALLPESDFKSLYAPINTYLRELQIGTKPETAAEGLFRALAKDVLNIPVVPQVGVGSGFVDFKLDALEDSSIVIELKPLFHRYSSEQIRRDTLTPARHIQQIQNYLQRSEYVVLTDLRDCYFYSARDVWQNLQPFAKITFAELIARGAEIGTLHDILRAAEDRQTRPDLDRSFFEHLKEWFAAFQSIRFKNELEHDELVILLINKIIFAKTMEDHSLVKYRQLQDDWERAKERWLAKGSRRIVQQFLYDFEEFFNDYYDTELFERPVWADLEATDKNYERFARLLEGVLGLDKWNQTFQRGIVHYNYRLINEDIFGKSYEMFLAANRKDEGIYYTPAGITVPMADCLVDTLVAPLLNSIAEAVDKNKCDFKTADALMEKLTCITIADTAAGSGGFLIKVLRAIWRHYQKIDDACAWIKKIKGTDLLDLPPNVQQAAEFRRRWNFDNRRVLVAQILVRHIFAVDKDAGAIEVAKTNLWKEAVKLSKEDYNFRKLLGDIRKTLPSLRMNFICADSLVDTDLGDQARYLHEVCGKSLQKLCALREEYIANPSEHAPLEEALELQKKLRENLTEHFQSQNLPAPALFAALSFFPAWFTKGGKPKGSARVPRAASGIAPDALSNDVTGATPATAAGTVALPGEMAGFDGVIGNPPWEGFKPLRKEFVAKLHENFSKYTMTGTDFTPWFEQKLKDEPEFLAQWNEYVVGYEKLAEFFSRRFKFQGGGDINLYKLFIENNLNLVRHGGGLTLLVPSGLQTDEGCGPLRKLMLTEHCFEELTSFENRGYTEIKNGKELRRQIFPDVDSRFKFSFFKVVKGKKPTDKHTFDARFYLHNPQDAFSPPIHYSVEMIRRFSPENFGIMEFRSETDYQLCTKIRGEHPLLKDFGFRLSTELHMTNDNHFFRKLGDKKPAAGQLPLYEGKMIHQFDANYSPGNFAVVEKEIREELLRKEIYRLTKLVREIEPKKLEGKPTPQKRDELEARLREIFKAKKFKLQYEFPRTAYREIGRSTDERTIIATEIPADACLNNKLPYVTPFDFELSDKGELEQVEVEANETRSLLALFNSLVLNVYLRSKISATLNMFYMYELPIPKISTGQKKKLAEAVAKLLTFSAKRHAQTKTPDSAQKKPNDVATRAELEVLIARDLYGLSFEDWKHLTGTFTFGGDSETKAELDEIIRRSLTLWNS